MRAGAAGSRRRACVRTDHNRHFPRPAEALQTALIAERQARQEAEARATGAEARATGAEAMVSHLKLVIVKLRRERFGPWAERGASSFDQLKLQFEQLPKLIPHHKQEAICHGTRASQCARSHAPTMSMPARSRRQHDKAKVEAAVQIIECWLPGRPLLQSDRAQCVSVRGRPPGTGGLAKA
jgi:hypothetical protein